MKLDHRGFLKTAGLSAARLGGEAEGTVKQSGKHKEQNMYTYCKMGTRSRV